MSFLMTSEEGFFRILLHFSHYVRSDVSAHFSALDDEEFFVVEGSGWRGGRPSEALVDLGRLCYRVRPYRVWPGLKLLKVKTDLGPVLWGPKGGGPQNFALFFFPSPAPCSFFFSLSGVFSVSLGVFSVFFFLSLGVFSWNFGGFLVGRALKCALFRFGAVV